MASGSEDAHATVKMQLVEVFSRCVCMWLQWSLSVLKKHIYWNDQEHIYWNDQKHIYWNDQEHIYWNDQKRTGLNAQEKILFSLHILH